MLNPTFFKKVSLTFSTFFKMFLHFLFNIIFFINFFSSFTSGRAPDVGNEARITAGPGAGQRYGSGDTG
jgi:hypothetical protein